MFFNIGNVCNFFSTNCIILKNTFVFQFQGNGKVYVLLTKPLDSNTQLRITLEANDAREVPVKRRNPFTLVFVIPGIK